MRKLRIFIVELVLVGILVGWYIWRFPETLDPLIPWILWAIFWHLSWEILLERDTIKLYVGGVAKKRNTLVIWLIAFVLGGLISIAYLRLAQGGIKKLTEVAESKKKSTAAVPAPASILIPSFVFVFGAPLGENNSPVWIMMLKHYGPNTAYNCDIVFVDEDRKNIEHKWLEEHPGSSFLPVGGVAGQSQVSFHIPEAGSEEPPQKFEWTPIDPNSQHYTVSISCRDGYFVEHWEVTRVNGVLRTKVTMEHGPQWVAKNPMRSPIVFTCTEPEFISTSLASALPARTPPLVNPGWKPNHRFDFPVAILDPNGNVQVMSGVKLPDGSQKTDFGCWNMLTKHFGDKP